MTATATTHDSPAAANIDWLCRETPGSPWTPISAPGARKAAEQYAEHAPGRIVEVARADGLGRTIVTTGPPPTTPHPHANHP